MLLKNHNVFVEDEILYINFHNSQKTSEEHV